MSKANRTLDEAVKLIKSIEISETFNAEVDLQLDIIEAIYQLQYKLERGYVMEVEYSVELINEVSRIADALETLIRIINEEREGNDQE